VRIEVKEPVPVPSDVWGSEIVGFIEILQHTPLAVTGEPPSLVTFPPEVADISVMMETAAVVTTGTLVAE
jgi:hypothetical protein